MDFFVGDWLRPEFSQLIGSNNLYVVSRQQCWKFHTVLATEPTCRPIPQRQIVPELHSTQEEADTRLLLHAKHAADNGAQTIVIQSPDTDVAVIGCALAEGIPARLIFRTGTLHQTHLIDLSLMSQHLGTVRDSLLGFHALTGCDSTSAFYGRGKKAGYKILQHTLHRSFLANVGEQFSVNETLLTRCQKFVCVLHRKDDQLALTTYTKHYSP